MEGHLTQPRGPRGQLCERREETELKQTKAFIWGLRVAIQGAQTWAATQNVFLPHPPPEQRSRLFKDKRER